MLNRVLAAVLRVVLAIIAGKMLAIGLGLDPSYALLITIAIWLFMFIYKIPDSFFK